MSDIERLVYKVENASSQEQLVLGESQSQTYYLNDDESEQLNQALNKKSRLKKLEFKHIAFSPASAGYLMRSCLSHPGLEEVKILLFRSVNSSSQKHAMRMLEDVPYEVDNYVTTHPDMRRLGFFKRLNDKGLKLTSSKGEDEEKIVYETRVSLPSGFIKEYIEPFLRPKKRFIID